MPGLLDLPKELRDQIVSSILIKPQNTITMLSNSHCFQSEVSASQPTISMVSKQLRAEALPIFYSSNHFLAELSNPDDLATARNWLAAIGDGNVRHLRHLVLSGWTKVERHEQGRPGHQHLYIRLVFDLRDGQLILENDRGMETTTPSAMWCIDGLKQAFRETFAAKSGRRFTAEEVGELMEKFHALCAAN